MNKKIVLIVLIASSVLLFVSGSLFIAFVNAVPEGNKVEENYLMTQDFANLPGSWNQQFSPLSGESERICATETIARAPDIELYYDDGFAETGYYWLLPEGIFAVRFTPTFSGPLISCRFYIYSDPATIKVHVLDADKNDMITPFSATPIYTGWFEVDLSSYGITVSEGVDFYIAMESTVSLDPSIGTDRSAPNSRSWEYNGVTWTLYDDRDYMIRAKIGTVPELVITDVYLEPEYPDVGDDVTFYADVENQGSGDADNFVVQLYLDEEIYAEDTFSLDAGDDTTYFNPSPWVAEAGTHTIRWVIDATDVIDETNEDNNEMSSTFGVGEYLTVTSPYGTPGGENWYDKNTNAYATLDTGTVDHGNGTRRIFTHWSGDASGTNYAQSNPIYMDGPKTAIANWKTQYYLTMDPTYGTVTPSSGWYDAGSTVTISATDPTATSDERYAWVGWTGTGSGSYSGTDKSASVTMNGPITETAEWKGEYYLTVTSPYGSPSPDSGWVEAGKSITVSAGSPASGASGTRYLCTGWSGSGSVPTSGTTDSATFTMDEASTITWNWKTQYYLTMSTDSGTVTPTSGWYDVGTTVTISATAPTATSDERIAWAGWTGTGSGSYSGTDNPASITMNGPITETATWRCEYYLTVTSSYGSPSPDSGWVEAGKSITVSAGSPASGASGTRYLCTGWSGSGSVPTSGTAASATFTMDETSSITWNWKPQYSLTMNASHGTVTPGSGWYDVGATVTISATAPTPPQGYQYAWVGWTGTGSGSYSGTDNPASITMNEPITENAEWRLEDIRTPTYIQAKTTTKGKTITVSGSITPAHEATVTLTYTMPDGVKFNRTVTSSPDGEFSYDCKVDSEGAWSVTASWPGDADSLGCTSSTMAFTVKAPEGLSWDMLQVILAVVGIVLSVGIVGAAWFSTHKKKSHIKNLLEQIDDAFFRFKRNSRRCEAELYRLRDMVLEEYKSGMITEASYSILNAKIDDYLSKLSEP